MSARRRRSDDRGTIRTVLTAVYVERDDGVIGFVEQLMGFSVHGRTIEEARERLENAARRYLEANREDIFRRFETTEARRETFTVDLSRE